uniref:Asparagine--tRNA ligase n=1 Tax=Schistocephalus solidus TaxID=70667 RepID=A0A0X3PAZ9_SCHSO
MPEHVAVGSAVSVRGRLVLRPLRRRHQQQEDEEEQKPGEKETPEVTLELVADVIRNLSGQPSAEIGSTTDADHSLLGAMSASRPKLGLLRSDRGLAWRHRVPEMAALLRLRAACKSIVHRVMQERAYLEVDTPILTRTDCEGAGETFLIQSTKPTLSATPDGSGELHSEENTDVHLTVSAQLHLEALALGMGRVYSLSPTFRAEPSHSRFHLAEFLMLEAESVLLDSSAALCTEMETIVASIVSSFLEKLDSRASDLPKDLHLVLSYLSESLNSSIAEHTAKLRRMLLQPFAKVTFTEATNYLQKAGRFRSSDGGLSKEEEQKICHWVGDRPVFVTDFPASMKPFYCASSSTAKESPACVQAVDLLVPDIGELIGGSVRETDHSTLAAKMLRQGLNPQSPSMAWYLGLRGHGGAPHAGFGLGFDRLLLWILGVYNIRDTVPFPRELEKIYM